MNAHTKQLRIDMPFNMDVMSLEINGVISPEKRSGKQLKSTKASPYKIKKVAAPILFIGPVTTSVKSLPKETTFHPGLDMPLP